MLGLLLACRPNSMGFEGRGGRLHTGLTLEDLRARSFPM
jgi:hypothetical protein